MSVGGGIIRDRRLDIQGLRALAVTLVVVFHVWPHALPGGYVGVDVFFVISGFLITSHLLAEVARTGTVSVTRFWARRIRRLLPASFLVLAAAVVLAFTVMPRSVLLLNLQEIAASAAYVVNWLLAFNAVDYLASENADSLVQHYWSLSVEEQFYILWPLLIILASFLATKVFAARRRTIIAATLGLVALLSFGYSVWETAANPAFAYFITPTRAWEFAAGGLIAFLPTVRTGAAGSLLVRRVGSWVSVFAILASAWLLTSETPFPGWIALIPVAGTAFLLWVGDDEHLWSPQYFSHHGSIQFVGDTSYAIYLWHWPLIIITPFVLGHPIGFETGLLIIVTSVVLATGTKFFVEDPVRRGQGWLRLRWPAYSFMAAGMAVLIVIAPIASTLQQAQLAASQTQAESASTTGCLGAPVMDPTSGCAWSQGNFITPPPEDPKSDALGQCMSANGDPTLEVCEYGADASSASRTVALIGDSHIAMYQAVMTEIAEQEGWRLIVMQKGSCPFTQAVRKTNAENAQSCVEWNAAVTQAIRDHPEIDEIITSASSKNGFDSVGQSGFEAGVDGYLAAWDAVPDTVEKIIVLRDAPRPRDDNLECLTALPDVAAQLEYGVCSLPRGDALLPDPAAEAAERAQTAGDSRVSLVDLSDLFCDQEDCLVVIGNTTVYRDGHHLTTAFSMSLEPYLRAGLGLEETS